MGISLYFGRGTMDAGWLERQLDYIAQAHQIRQASPHVKQQLAQLHPSIIVHILQDLFKCKVRSLDGLILHMIKQANVHSIAKSEDPMLKSVNWDYQFGNSKSQQEYQISLETFEEFSSELQVLAGLIESHLESPTKCKQAALPRTLSGGTLDTINRKVRNRYLGEHRQDQDQSTLKVSISEKLLTLGELDFGRRFQLLRTIGEEELERLTLNEIKAVADMSLDMIQSYFQFPIDGPRVQFNDVANKKDLQCQGQRYMYKCSIDKDGKCTLLEPENVDVTTHLQDAFGDDKLLAVSFSKQGSKEKHYKILKEGLFIGLRRYQYFVHKEEKKGVYKCYFLCISSVALSDKNDPHFRRFKDIMSARLYMMHINTVASVPLYNKRLQLLLSKTYTLAIDISDIDIYQLQDVPCKDMHGEVVKDVHGKPLIHTDGTGYISEDIARMCPLGVFKGKYLEHTDEHAVCPSLLQIRLFYAGNAIKGTLLVHKELPPKTICIRDSMLKVKRDIRMENFATYDSLEICSTSRRPKDANLSRYLVALLTIGGVSGDIFLEATRNAISKAEATLKDRSAALKLCSKTEWERKDIAVRMLKAGISLKDPYLRSILKDLVRMKINDYKEAKVPLQNCFYLMGTSDPSGRLKRNEVAILLNGPVYCEKVLVYRNPGIHPGDIHIFRATWHPELQNILADGKYVILFPTKGPRSIVDEIAGGDLDGDLYWICMDQEVVKQFHSSAPWSHPPKPKEKSQKPSDMSYSQLEDELIKQVLDTMHHPSYAAGMSATNWLAHVDQYLMLGPEQHANRKVLEQILTQLMNINYAALISEKTGEKVTVPADLIAKKRPHFMKEGKEFYKSTSILGQIYDIVDNANQLDAEDSSPIYYPEFVYGGYKSHKSKWKGYFDEYRNEMSRACRLAQPFKSSRAEEIKQKYRSILYEAETLKLCPKPLAVIYEEAAAIYEVVCDHARENMANQRSSSCSFAWTVAGHALCRLYAEEQPGEPYVCAATVMTEVAGKLDLV